MPFAVERGITRMLKSLLLALSLTFAVQDAPAQAKPGGMLANEIAGEQLANGICRTGSVNDPATVQACAVRDSYVTMIEAQGWCSDHDQKKWKPCETAPPVQPDSPLYSDEVLTPEVFNFMPESLKAAKEDFATRLSFVVPIVETEDGFFFGTGCAAHECGQNETAWVINKTTHKSAAIIMKYIPASSTMAAYENFELYGTADGIPTPLAAWAVQQGMTEGNAVEVQ
jgi:hypothetical protein